MNRIRIAAPCDDERCDASAQKTEDKSCRKLRKLKENLSEKIRREVVKKLQFCCVSSEQLKTDSFIVL